MPGPGQVRISVRAAGVGPTDLAIRAGHLQQAFPLPPQAVLGFECAGVVDALGPGVAGVAVGDEVAALLPGFGGYAELAVAPVWARRPAGVSWEVAAAVPASAEAAVGVLRQVAAGPGDVVLVLGGGGSVGLIAVQLALAAGASVVAVAGAHDADLLRGLGAEHVEAGPDLVRRVRTLVPAVDAAVDAAGRGGLADAVELAGGPDRVVTLADPGAAALGVRLSEPGPDRAPDALDVVLPLVAAGDLVLRGRRTLPLDAAAHAHRLLESGSVHGKVVLLR